MRITFSQWQTQENSYISVENHIENSDIHFFFLISYLFFMQQLNFSLNTQKSQYIQKILAFYSLSKLFSAYKGQYIIHPQPTNGHYQCHRWYHIRNGKLFQTHHSKARCQHNASAARFKISNHFRCT